MENRKNKYTNIRNILYYMNSIWQWNKMIYMFLCISIIAHVGLSVINIYIPKIIIESIEEMTNLSNVVLLASKIGAIYLIFNLCSFYVDIVAEPISMYMPFYFNERIIEKLVGTDFCNIISNNGKILKQKAYSFAKNSHLPFNTIKDFLKNLLGLLIYTIILARLNFLVILLLMICSILNLFIGKTYINYREKLKDKNSSVEKKLTYLSSKSMDIQYAKELRLYSIRHLIVFLFSKSINHKLILDKELSKKYVSSSFLKGLLTLTKDGIAYLYLIYQVINGNITVPEMVLFFGAIAGITKWMNDVAENLIELNKISKDILDFRKFNDMPDTKRDIDTNLKKGEEADSIEFKNVCFSYENGKKKIFENLNFRIEKGDKIAIVGTNGAGKSTLVKLLTGLLTPQKGNILINGLDAKKCLLNNYYSLFSVSFQDALLVAFTIEENITMKKPNKVNEKEIEEAYLKVGLNKKINKFPKGIRTTIEKLFDDDGIELSGGEKQQIFLARALYKNAPILILDEPTSALDPVAESKLYEKYNELTKDKIALYISHRLSSAKFCDEIIFLDNGKMTEKGSHNALMKNNKEYAKMYKVQSQYYQ